jgi:hypothetical protein
VPPPSRDVTGIAVAERAVRIAETMRLGTSMIDVKLQRHGDDVTVNLLRRQGDAKVMLVK